MEGILGKESTKKQECLLRLFSQPSLPWPGRSIQIGYDSSSLSCPAWWATHQQALHLFRALDALLRMRPYLLPGTLAWRRLERDQAQIEAAIEALREHRPVGQ